MRSRWTLVFAFVALSLTACASSRGRMKMGDLNAAIANATGLDGDPLEKTPVEYEQVGLPEYDNFFVQAATIQAGVVVSSALLDALTTNLKTYAIAYAAAHAAEEGVKSLVNGRPLDQITGEEALTLVMHQKTLGQLTDDEVNFAKRTAANTAQTALYLVASVKSTVDLINTGRSLSSKVTTDFTGLKAGKAPAVASALTTSVDNLSGAATTLPDIAKKLARIGEGLSSLM
jgi:hypothetical protein